MANEFTCILTLTLVLWLNVFHAPHVTAFFEYNKFRPVPFRPDLQEYCPQVRQPVQLAIQTNSLLFKTEMNW